jgi:predicted porin
MHLRKKEVKRVLAAGILTAMVALNAGAAPVYEKDGTKVELKGDLQIQLYQKVGKDQDLKMDYDDLTVAFGAKHELESGLKAFGLLKMDWKKQADGTAAAAVDEGFVGLGFGMMSLEWGRLDWGSDSFHIDQAIEIADGLSSFPEVGGHESAKVTVDFGAAKLILSGDLEVADNSSAAEAYLVTNPKKVAGLALGLLYQSFEPDMVEADEEAGTAAFKPDAIDTLGVRAQYTINKIALGANYTTNDDEDVANVSVRAPIPNTPASVGLGMGMEMPDQGDDVNTWYANVKHKVHKNATVFAEVGGNDKKSADLGYLAGMQVKF